MVWETLPAIHTAGTEDRPVEARWPFLPHWSAGRLPMTKAGKLLSTANARLRTGDEPFAPTFMTAWRKDLRVLLVVSWFYEFDSRFKPQVPYAVFNLDQPFWVFAGLGSWSRDDSGEPVLSAAVITVDPNQVLRSVGHHRSPAILRTGKEAATWLHGNRAEALALLRPSPDESMGVEAMPMNIKIPGNQAVEVPPALRAPSSAPG